MTTTKSLTDRVEEYLNNLTLDRYSSRVIAEKAFYLGVILGKIQICDDCKWKTAARIYRKEVEAILNEMP